MWFKAFAQMAVTRCGISARQLGRDLGIRPNTALRIWRQIRGILTEDSGILTGKVEIDETYIGGKRSGPRGRGAAGKTIVMGMVERGGKVRAKVVPDVKARTLLPEIEANVLKDAVVYTDDLLSYRGVARMGYVHKTVAHSLGQYVLAKDIHTNSVEGFWSQLKRSIDGTYHHVTPHHLQGYVNEYAFRYSHRKDEEPMFWTMLGEVIKKAV
jgi:transposase-like protein